MSMQNIIQSIAKLVDIHTYLLEISEQKTEAIKKGTIDELQALLTKERKYTQLLEQIEIDRMEKVNAWLSKQGNPSEQAEMTVTSMLEMLENEREKLELANITTKLTHTITELKQQEQLNRDLIDQSMKFIHMSLNMIQPTIENMNYNKHQSSSGTSKRSLFDSKA
ncbi:flagellar protein FlgN [Virgibacillus sp. W0181]|uniref:flagellar protein FlgN n=1 Tax=Virgibacillus sp. W0181 TaxID=3391581 RepID=UPI003F4596E9